MSVIPIQVTSEGVLIPKTYLDDASEVEVVVGEDYVLVRPRPVVREPVTPDKETELPESRFDFIGIGHTRDPLASRNAEAILEREIKRTSGWSLD
ncbi:MAG: hypothetical protein HY327_04150 [Chloroflexi bacterium]|nr:hypothetical protein [Chloroflexota bacterium]